MKRLYILPIFALLTLTITSGLILSSTFVSADNNSDVVDNIAITVPESCTLSGDGMNSHTATINPGTYNSSIGLTTITAFCNDNQGFSIYAIGYTDEEDGKNVLTSSALGSTSDIATGTATSGNTSNWAMKLAIPQSPTPTYPMTIQSDTEGSFSSFHTVPDDYTLVAKRTSSTDVGTNAEGSSLTTTYQTYISQTQPAGTYLGKVKYTMVHPNDAPAPYVPHAIACEPKMICFYPNTDQAEGTMSNQSLEQTIYGHTVILDFITLNLYSYKRAGYSFAGWSDAYDYKTNPNAHFYGPQEAISVTQDAIDNGLSLYAVWVEPEGNLQDTTRVNSVCNSLTTPAVDGSANLSSVSALIDQRDNQIYTIAKLADGRCWMTENLRLSDQHTTSAADIALAQGYHSSFIGLANSEPVSAFNSNSTTANSLYSTDGSTAVTISGNYQGSRFPRYSHSSSDTFYNNFGYGDYYTWAAAIADTSNHDSNNISVTNTSICPSGWRLPSFTNQISVGAGSNDFYELLVNLYGVAPSNYDSYSSPYYTGNPTQQLVVKFPNNFVYAGSYSGGSSSLGGHGSYLSSTPKDNAQIYSFYYTARDVYAAGSTRYKADGASIRCIFDPST